LRDILAPQVKLAAHDFARKENPNEQRWQRALGWCRRLGIRQHALYNIVMERSSLNLLDDRPRHLQLVLRCVLCVDEVNLTLPK